MADDNLLSQAAPSSGTWPHHDGAAPAFYIPDVGWLAVPGTGCSALPFASESDSGPVWVSYSPRNERSPNALLTGTFNVGYPSGTAIFAIAGMGSISCVHAHGVTPHDPAIGPLLASDLT